MRYDDSGREPATNPEPTCGNPWALPFTPPAAESSEADAWERLGERHYEARSFDEARRAFEQVTLLRPLSYSAQACLADIYLRNDSTAAARAIFTHLATHPRADEGRMALVASGLGRLGEYRLAVEVCRESCRRDPSCDAAWFGLAFYLARAGSPPEAILPPLEQAHRLDPRCPLYWLGLAVQLARLHRFDEAYGFARRLQPASIRCPRCCGQVAWIMDHAGDTAGRDRWLTHLATCLKRTESAAGDATDGFESLDEAE